MVRHSLEEYKFNNLTAEEQRKIAKLGGIKSGKVRGALKSLREDIEIYLEKHPDEQIEMIVSMINQAKKGNTKAFEVIRDTKGEKPVERTIDLSDHNPDFSTFTKEELIIHLERLGNGRGESQNSD